MSDQLLTNLLVDIPAPAPEWNWAKTSAWLGALVGSACIWIAIVAIVAQTAF